MPTKGIIACRHQDEIDLFLSELTEWDESFENWADVRYLWELQSTQRDLEAYLDERDEDTILFVSGITWTTVPKHTIVGINNAIAFGYNRSKFPLAVELLRRLGS